MVRPKRKLPKKLFHLSGQDVVYIGRRCFYLGESESPLALARYAVLVAKYQAGGFGLPDDFTIEDIDPQVRAILAATCGVEPAVQADEPVLVLHVTAAFRDHVRVRYQNSPKEIARADKTCKEIDQHYGKLKAEQFGPRALQQQRDRWVHSGMTRRYVNRLVRQVQQMFRYAVGQEMIAESVWSRLKAVEGLRAGQCEAKEGSVRVAVPLDHVRLTFWQLSPVLKAMLRVAVGTGMRPSEICKMRPCDIDRSKAVWMYRPQEHKTAKIGKRKAVPIVGDAREAIEDYLNRDPANFCFSPRESMQWFLAQKRSKRVTPDSCGNRPGTNRKADPQKQPGERFDAGSFRQAIERAAKRAGVPRWTPYQIRHAAGCSIRDILGLDAAQALLGHSSAAMAEHYAKLSEAKAIEAAKAAPALFEKPQ